MIFLTKVRSRSMSMIDSFKKHGYMPLPAIYQKKILLINKILGQTRKNYLL